MQKGKKTKNSFNTMIKKLLILPKMFLVITVIFIMWIVILLSAPLFGVFEPDWLGLSPSLWLILISTLIAIFIVIDIILYASPRFFISSSLKQPSFQPVEFPEVEQRYGKQVFEFTYPAGAKGGVFSKTYVQISNDAICRIRNQMMKKEDIWEQ